MSDILTLSQLEQFCEDNSLSNFDARHYKESTRAEIINNISYPKNPLIIGTFGSAFEKGNVPERTYNEAIAAAKSLAKQLSEYKNRLVLVTGFCPDGSIPSLVAEELKNIAPSVPVIGISPWKNIDEARKNAVKEGKQMNITQKVHDLAVYSDFGSFRMRDGLNCHFVDGAIAMRGSTGTNDEIAGLYETGKVVGRLIGFGGSTDAQNQIVRSFQDDGKHHYVEISSDNPYEVVRKLIGQINVDQCLKKGQESSSIDLYVHHSASRGVEPIINIRRFRIRAEEKEWQDAKDRAYPFITYTRPDLTHAGKLLIGMQKAEVREYIQDLLYREVFEISTYRKGEVGILMFPSKKGIHHDVPAALEVIARQETEKVFYNRLDSEKLVA